MGLISFLRGVYDLGTLDNRFVDVTSVPYQTVADAHNDAAGGSTPRPRAQASKWRTPEYSLYGVIFVLVIPYMFWIAYDVSRPSDPRYAQYQDLLTDGWIPGRKVDVSDAQYHTFRGNIPYMAALLIVHPLLRTGWEATYTSTSSTKWLPSPSLSSGPSRLARRASFDCYFSLFFLLILHGVSSFKVLAILYLNFQLAMRLQPRCIPVVTWVFNISILFANEICQGYRFEKLAGLIAPADAALVQWGHWLDGHGGLVPRWEVLFNISILRLISFNMDYFWSIDRPKLNLLEKKQVDAANLSERDRITLPADAGDFSFRNYLAYTVYAPLYLAGPILTFNDYVAQAKHRAASIETRRTIRYAARFLLVLLAMELVLHYDYVGAIGKASPDWSSYTPAQLSLLSYFNLHIIWLKLLLPWRLFRLWALVDGMDPPENMVRCLSNNYSTQLFWRAWHRSYNRWIIRYLYVPLGGSSFHSLRAAARSVLTYLLVFTFVALWHDIQLHLLVWGWLIVLFMVPEWVATFLLPPARWEARPTAYRMLCCIGAVANVLMMMVANLIGFAVGLDGLESIVRGILHEWSGVVFVVVACSCLFVGVQVMFEIRESEKRKGVRLRC